MMSVTLSCEQIRRAPAEVKRWIGQELAAALDSGEQTSNLQHQGSQLACCTRDELASMLSLIEGVFPAVNVLFELGRKGIRFAQDRLEAYRLADIQHHTRLQSSDQVVACLRLIEESLRRIRGSTEAAFYGVDGEYCFVATETQQNIRRLWFDLIGHGEMPPPGAEAAADEGSTPRELMPIGNGSGVRSATTQGREGLAPPGGDH